MEEKKKASNSMSTEEYEFPCTRCGACCIFLPKHFGFDLREDGACIHLSEDNLCKIYDERPQLCRHQPETTYEHHAVACNWLQEREGMDVKFRLEVKR